MKDYLVICEYADGGAIRVVQFFDDEANAKEYARLKTKRAKEKDGSWADTFYAVKKL